MENIKKIKDKGRDFYSNNRRLVFIFITIASIPLILLILTKLNPSNKDIRKINEISKNIYEINTNLKIANSDKSIDTEIAKSSLNSNLVELNKIKSELTELDVKNTNLELKDKFTELLNLNISVYDKAQNMYMDPTNKKLSKKLKEFKTSLDLLINTNKSTTNLGINTILPKESIIFFENTYSYFNTLVQVNMLNDITNNKKREFLLSSSNILDSFNKIKEDLKPAVDDIIKNNRDTATIYEDISSKKLEFENIKNTYFSISIPEDASSIKSSIENCISLYDIYISKLDSALKAKNQLDLDAAFSKYSDFLQFYDNLCKEIEEYKSK